MHRLSLALALLCVAACQTTTFGDAIGRPPQDSLVQTSTAGIDIVEVDPVGEAVTISVSTDADLSAYELQNAAGNSVSLAIGLFRYGPDQGTGVLGLATAPANAINVGQSGDIAVVETTTGVVESYFAWGEDPSARHSSLFVKAVTSGVVSTPIAVPFPRPVDTSIVRTDKLIGCNSNVGASDDPVACDPVASPLTLREVGPPSFIELELIGPDILDVGGVRVCHDGQCVGLTDDLVANPGDVIVVASGEETSLEGALALGGSDISGDTETWLAEPGTDDPQYLLDYMRTKDGPSQLVENAIEDGLWVDTRAPIGTYISGESLSRNPGTDSWYPALATPGAVNPVIDPDSNWQSCVETPADAKGTAPSVTVVAQSIDRATSTITLRNASDAAVDLSTITVSLDGTAIAVSGSLSVNTTASFSTGSISDAGKLEIASGGTLIQFAQWGNPASGVSAAIAASVWPASTCLLSRLQATSALVLRDPIFVHGSSGYIAQ